MWQDLIVEYVAGFMFGLLIFMALFMRRVMGAAICRTCAEAFCRN